MDQTLEDERARHAETGKLREVQEQRRSLLEIDVEGARAKATSAESECATLRTECASLRERLAACEAQVEHNNIALPHALDAAGQAAVDCRALQQQVATGVKEKQEQVQQVGKLRQVFDDENFVCSQMRDKLHALQDELNASNVHAVDLETELLQQKSTVHKMEEQFSLAQASMQMEKKTLEERIQERSDQVARSKSEVDKLSREMERLGCKVEELQALKCQQDEQLSSAQTQLDHLREQQGLQRAELEQELHVLQHNVVALTQETDALTCQIEQKEVLLQTSRQDKVRADEEVSASVCAFVLVFCLRSCETPQKRCFQHMITSTWQ
jgi:chromosome segregation ATPase